MRCTACCQVGDISEPQHHLRLGDPQAVDVQFVATEATECAGLVLGKDRIKEVGQATGTQAGYQHAIDCTADADRACSRRRPRRCRSPLRLWR